MPFVLWQIVQLRSVDNVYVIVHFAKDFGLSGGTDVEMIQKICDEVPKIDWARAFRVWSATHSSKEYDLTPMPGHEKGYQVDVEAMARQRTSAAKAAQNRGSRGGRGRGRGGRGGGRQERNRNHKDRHLRGEKASSEAAEKAEPDEVESVDGGDEKFEKLEEASYAADSGVSEVHYIR